MDETCRVDIGPPTREHSRILATVEYTRRKLRLSYVLGNSFALLSVLLSCRDAPDIRADLSCPYSEESLLELIDTTFRELQHHTTTVYNDSPESRVDLAVWVIDPQSLEDTISRLSPLYFDIATVFPEVEWAASCRSRDVGNGPQADDSKLWLYTGERWNAGDFSLWQADWLVSGDVAGNDQVIVFSTKILPA